MTSTINLFKLAENGKTAELESELNNFPDAIHKKDEAIGMQILHHACSNGHSDCISMLLQHGASIHEKDSMGRTAFFFTWPFVDCARLMLQHGSDVNTKDNYGYTALHNCCYHGNYNVAKLILEETEAQVPDRIAINPRNGDTILHSVCRNGHVQIVILLIRHGAYINIKNNDNVTPFECFKHKIQRNQVEIITSDEKISVETIREDSYELWFWLIQETDELVTSKVADYVNAFPELAHAKDSNGRSAVEIASKQNKIAIQSLLLWFGRYRVVESRPEHTSQSCFVYKALDERELDSSNNPRQVALKLMRYKSQFLREVETRRKSFDADYVVNILNTFPNSDEDENTPLRPDVVEVEVPLSDGGVVEILKTQAEQFYTIVMPLADRNMFVAMKQERFSGRDMGAVRHVFSQLCRCVAHLHSKGFIHGDIKPLNMVRDGSQWKLIDLDASAAIGQDAVCSKFSSAYLPPEAIYVDSEEMKDVKVRSTDWVTEDRLLTAHPSFDVWSLGCVLYQLCNADIRPLFICGQDDNLNNESDDDDNLWSLVEWSTSTKTRKLAKVTDPLARNLLAQMLCKDPSKRPTLTRVLAHPFLSGNKVVRLLDEKAKYDVFLSYRVASDSLHVERLYEGLTTLGLKVWWDKKCLLPGIPWKDGFCEGLACSRSFVCLLSREAINHSTKDWQNFSKLHESSTCDNVFLEHRLALELRHLGLIERIFPVMIGDYSEGDKTYGSYFAAGCHPKPPDIVVTSVENDLLYYMDSLSLGFTMISKPTVASTLTAITACQGSLVQGDPDEAFHSVVMDIQRMLKDEDEEVRALQSQSRSQSISSSNGHVLGLITTSPREPIRTLLVSKDEEIRVLREQLLKRDQRISSLEKMLK